MYKEMYRKDCRNMRISEIKSCISDEKIRTCIKKDFWEDEVFRKALEKEKVASIETIYAAIKDVFISELEEKEKISPATYRLHRRKICHLSKLIYGDRLYWALDTEWYDKEKKHEEITRKKARHSDLDFLYERLSLKKSSDYKKDIIYMCAMNDAFYEDIINSEETIYPIFTLKDLYSHCCKVANAILKERKLTYYELRLIKSASYLAFSDAEFFLKENNLTVLDVFDDSNE